MIRTLVQWSWRGLLLSTLAAMSSCGGVPLTGQGGQLTGQLLPEDGAGGPPNDDGRPVSDNGSFALCGNRAVRSLPGRGFLKLSMSISVDATPPDSALERVIFGGFDCQQFQETGASTLYEVGEQGAILSTVSLLKVNSQKVYVRGPAPAGWRFVVRDGCLSLEGGAEPPEWIGPPEVPDWPCTDLAQPAFAVDHNGLVTDPRVDDYICFRTRPSWGNAQWPSLVSCWRAYPRSAIDAGRLRAGLGGRQGSVHHPEHQRGAARGLL